MTARLHKVRLRHPAFADDGKDDAWLACNEGFDPRRPFNVALFFHGFDRPLDEQVERHRLAEQVAACGQNTVLVCPRTAVDRAAERNPGAFGDAAHFAGFLDELPGHIAALAGDPGLDGPALAARVAHARLVLIAFSAGHGVASAVLSHPAVRGRIAALAFFDALYRGNAYYRCPDLVLETGALVGIYGAGYHRAVDGDHHGELAGKLAAMDVVPASALDGVDDLRAGTAVLERVDIDDHWQIVAEGGRLGLLLSKVKVEGGGDGGSTIV